MTFSAHKNTRSTDEIDTNILIKTDDTAEPSTNTNHGLQMNKGRKNPDKQNTQWSKRVS